MKGYLHVERDDAQYDKKSGFKSYAEANNYREQCQFGWINHSDIVYYVDENDRWYELTGMADVKKFCEEHDIPYGY